ncbi:MAG TPA: VOC family protein [Actinospica sp.]|nr:VOC family protein [Actinospica sp.]
MEFTSIRIITGDVARLVAFYEKATGGRATWATEDFAQVRTATATLAIGSLRTVGMLPADTVRPAENRGVIIEFQVADVDALHAELRPVFEEFVLEPTTMPWGNRSMLLRDPDGNLVNFFTRPAAAGN